ncbi:MAG: DarT ssDNA thymidine ADP-ribosyltransferase family protein [Bacillota bacterium]
MTLSIMKPSDIIYNSTPFLPEHLRKLTKYAFHFTDISNACGILNHGKIYSRNRAIQNRLMLNDNAANDVINGTVNGVHDFVRFYFRPKTPTQFHNEGIRARGEIHTELKAHCPVPVFFIFDINKLLDKENFFFTHESLASHHAVDMYNYQSDPQALVNAPFNHIYHFNAIQAEENQFDVIKGRHAEIITEDECDLTNLKAILCRNRSELKTLKSLLSSNALDKYGDKLKLPKDPSVYFYNKYLRVSTVTFDSNKDMSITWLGTKQHNNYVFKFEIYSVHTNKKLAYGTDVTYNPAYQMRNYVSWLTGEFLQGYTECKVQIFIDDHLVYQDIHSL